VGYNSDRGGRRRPLGRVIDRQLPVWSSSFDANGSCLSLALFSGPDRGGAFERACRVSHGLDEGPFSPGAVSPTAKQNLRSSAFSSEFHMKVCLAFRNGHESQPTVECFCSIVRLEDLESKRLLRGLRLSQ